MSAEPLDIYLSYVPADEQLLLRLRAQLSAIERIGLVDVWHDAEVEIGTDREAAMMEALGQSSIILLLVSADYFASEFAYEKEMKRALELHASGEAKVVPVILRECTWKYTPLAQLRVLPEQGIPVTNDHWQNPDRALNKVVEEIMKLVEVISKPEVSSGPATTPIDPNPARVNLGDFPTIQLNGLYWTTANLAIPDPQGTVIEGEQGFFYNYDSAKQICPPGWRLPSKKEWAALNDAQVTQLQLSYNGLYDRGYSRDLGRKAYYWTGDRAAGGEAWCFERSKDRPGRMERRYTHWCLSCRLVKE